MSSLHEQFSYPCAPSAQFCEKPGRILYLLGRKRTAAPQEYDMSSLQVADKGIVLKGAANDFRKRLLC